MATKKELRGSTGSLSDTLAVRNDPSFSPEVAGRWVAVTAHADMIGRRIAEWSALPDTSDDYDEMIQSLVDATHDLVVAGSTTTRLQALDRADLALDRLDALLDVADEGSRSAETDAQSPDVP